MYIGIEAEERSWLNVSKDLRRRSAREEGGRGRRRTSCRGSCRSPRVLRRRKGGRGSRIAARGVRKVRGEKSDTYDENVVLDKSARASAAEDCAR